MIDLEETSRLFAYCFLLVTPFMVVNSMLSEEDREEHGKEIREQIVGELIEGDYFEQLRKLIWGVRK